MVLSRSNPHKNKSKQLVWLLILCSCLQMSALRAQIRYRLSDIFKSPIEYRTPFKMSLFDLKVGFTNLGAQSLTFDSTETELKNFDYLLARSMNSINLDLFKINYPYYLIPQNFIDLHTGLGISYCYALFNLGLPDDWQPSSVSEKSKYYFAPQLATVYLNQSALYQLTPRLYSYLQFNAGRSYASLYKNKKGQRYLDQEGWQYTIAVGLKLLEKAGPANREGLGVEINYNFAQFDPMRDPRDISPITHLKFNSLGIMLTFNPIMGGSPTVGDEAKKLFRRGDYIAAKANFQSFIQTLPKHPRHYKAVHMIDKCNQFIPNQEVQLADTLIKAENYGKAVRYLAHASQSAAQAVQEKIAAQYDSIRAWFTAEMDSMLRNNQIDQAENRLNQVANLNIPATQTLIDQYSAEIYFHRGVVFTEYEAWEQAIKYFDLAVKANPAIRERVNPWLLKIAYGYVQDVNKSVDVRSVELALESLRNATSLRQEIAFLTEKYIQNLENGVTQLKRQAAQKQFQTERQTILEPPEKLSSRLKIGMHQHQVLDVLGPPSYQNHYVNQQDQRYELWLYQYAKEPQLELYFYESILQKIIFPD